MVAAPPPSPPAIVRAWSAALNRNDNAAAAQLFAPGARVIQGSLDVRLTQPLAVAFNASLPCAGRIVHLTNGKITLWEQVAVPAQTKSGGLPA